MFEDVTQQTLDLLNKMPANGLAKTTISTTLSASGLNAFDLRGPALTLVPVLTPLRNTLPRETSAEGDVATRWKTITAINSGMLSVGVQEGKRGGEMAITEADVIATYAGLGMEGSINWEAVWSGGKMFDNKATLTKNLLNAFMIAEEAILLGGNNSLALGTPTAPVATLVLNSTTAGTMTQQATLGYVVALTLEGLRTVTKSISGLGLQPVLAATACPGSVTRTNIDGTTTTYGGGNSQVSAASNSVTTDATHGTISYTCPAVKGAAGYAWYAGASAATAALCAVTTINAVTIIADGAGTQKANNAAMSADNSVNALHFDGFTTIAQKTGGGYYKTLDGAALTSDSANGIVEIDAAFKSFWDNFRLSPDEMWCHSTESKNMAKKIVNAGTSSLVRFAGTQGADPNITGGSSITKYWNRYTQRWVMVNTHPNISQGQIFFKTNEIPYPMAEVGVPNLVRCRRDYYQIEWPWVSRQYVYGIYTDQVLVARAPLGLGMITNILDN